MNRISIIGCGWYGLPLGARLVKKGFVVSGSTTRDEKRKELKQVGIHDYRLVLDPKVNTDDQGLFDCDIAVINIPPKQKGGYPGYHNQQLLSLRNALVECQVTKVIFISSTGVYPNLNRVVTEEDASPEAKSKSGVPLLPLEEVFSGRDFETTVLRMGGLYGQNRHPVKFLTGRTLDGADNPVNMIHLDDAIGATEAVIFEDLWGEVLNACSPNHQTKREFYEEAAQRLGVNPPVFTRKPGDFKEVSSQKLIDKLQYRFAY